jgi:two-component system response regulator FlrC
LRERIADIVPIAQRLLHKYCAPNETVELMAEAQQKLVSHGWSGNVRELDNVIQRAMILKSGDQVFAEHIHYESEEFFDADNAATAVVEDSSVLVSDLKDREQQLILEALRAGNGSRKYAAERLGISPRTLRYKLARMRDAGITV